MLVLCLVWIMLLMCCFLVRHGSLHPDPTSLTPATITFILSLCSINYHLMSNFKILSWNVQGLNSKFKRSLVLQYPKDQQPHIVLLQETHLTGSGVLSLNRGWIQRAIHSTHSSYARGVAILIHKKLTCSIEHVGTDPQGRYAHGCPQQGARGVKCPPPGISKVSTQDKWVSVS